MARNKTAQGGISLRRKGHGMACRDFAGHHAFYWHCYHGRSVDGTLL